MRTTLRKLAVPAVVGALAIAGAACEVEDDDPDVVEQPVIEDDDPDVVDEGDDTTIIEDDDGDDTDVTDDES